MKRDLLLKHNHSLTLVHTIFYSFVLYESGGWSSKELNALTDFAGFTKNACAREPKQERERPITTYIYLSIKCALYSVFLPNIMHAYLMVCFLTLCTL